MNKKVLALDFDGVLWDSVGECFETGWRAYLEMTGRTLSDEAHRKSFYRGRPLARTGHDFYLLFALMEENPDRDLASIPLEEFVGVRQSRHSETLRFEQIFYRLRNHYRKSEPDLWVSWQGPYPEVIAALDQWEEHFSGAALATTKDTESAQFLLNTAERYWPVFGKEFSTDKADQIHGIAQHFRVAPTQVLFIDDLVENLDQVRSTGATTVLADWGYNLPESWRVAETKGYRTISVEGLAGLFKDFLDADA